MDAAEVGRRLGRARASAKLTQQSLGDAVGLDRTAITRLEHGERRLDVTELIRIAQVLERPLTYFVEEQPAVVVSRRRASAGAHDSSDDLDDQLLQFVGDVTDLLDLGLLSVPTPIERRRTPRSHTAAEGLADKVRHVLGLGWAPIVDLPDACQRLGLYVLVTPLSEDGPDGACVETEARSATAGVAVINGDAPSGRRRMTLAHELGHWLSGDAFDAAAGQTAEQMVSSFAIHLLAPRAGVQHLWSSHEAWDLRDRALLVSATFRVSWSAALGQLVNLGLIDRHGFESLRAADPKAGDYLRLGLAWTDDLPSPSLSAGFSAAVMNGYSGHRLTADRAVTMLRGTLARAELPARDLPSLDDYRSSFTRHGV